MSAAAWHTLPAEGVAGLLTTGPRGLDAAEATRRLEEYGPNEIEPERPTPWWMLALHQFRDPLIYILLIAAGVTLALRDYTDAAVIGAVVVLNAVIGFVQELRAQQAMQSIARMSAPRAEVLRASTQRTIPARELVPGDVVILAAGVRVPADIRLTHVRDLALAEAALTGESLAVAKRNEPLEAESLVPGDQTNMAFAGTIVVRGRGTGYVVRTGAGTELGQIATAVREQAQTATPLQEKMERFGRQIGYTVAALTALIIGIGLLRGLPPAEIFLTAVAMAVSAVPEGLPIVLTVTLAIGIRRMATRNAIIRALPAVETLGSTTVIGSDKTGTLTRNEMTVGGIWAAGAGYESRAGDTGGFVRDGAPAHPSGDEALRATLLTAVLASEARPAAPGQEAMGDPTELALFEAAARAGLDPVDIREEHPELDMIPFESERRYMATLNDGLQGRTLHLKGAPEVVLARCRAQLGRSGVERLDADAVRAAADALTRRGMRVLAMAFRPFDGERLDEQTLDGDGLILAGLQGMHDPVRPEAVAAVAAAKEAGIRVLMLTGDHAGTARAVGRELGLTGRGIDVVEGHEIENLSDAELDLVLARADVFARVAPDHKLRVVQRLRELGEVVAVTGDGVNDAPALRAAHLGVAMGRGGTDVAREASDMVLADDNFATITAAVEEGRVVFGNIRKVTFFLLSTAVGEVLTLTIALVAGWPLPFVAAQILWINLVTNGLQDVALAFEPGEPHLLRRPPRAPNEGILTARLMERLVAVGLVITAGTLGVFWWVLSSTGDVALARSAAVTQMVVFQFFHVFNSRSLDRSIFAVPPFSNRFLFVSLLAAAAAHLGALYWGPLQSLLRLVPLDAAHWLVLGAVGTTIIAGGELDKWRNRRLRRPLG